ncbi:nitronate monooxygenase [Agilicoccus flavus]|uniref:nitronate monooxygenase n=1 Tax=Agilicoccus flavus TaxID=2775968 RepID=UPI001CF6BF7E|nr:nitronate monooxygenase [Agilicoccus flavus]
MAPIPASPRLPLPRLASPVYCAPMVGGPSTPELAAAVRRAGGLGVLAGGYRTAEQMAEQIAGTRALADGPVGVNLLVPQAAGESSLAEETAVAAYREVLEPEAQRLGVDVGAPRWGDDDDWAAKVDRLVEDPVEVVSFTFGVPPRQVVDALHEVGTCALVTVTDRGEADAAVAGGADALVVQGCEAGGHRGTHGVAVTPNRLDHIALLELLADLDVPLIAAGGVTTAGDTRRALDLGAVAVQAGTAFLLADEAGTPGAYRMGLSDHALTPVMTRAFSGRPARGLRNRFVDAFDPYAPAVYPVVDQLTGPLRARAAREGDLGGVSLWAGSGWRAAREAPAADIVADLTPA